LTDDTKPSGTEGGADGNFTAAADGPRKEKIGNVGAGDQEYQTNDAEQDEECLTHRASEQLAQRNELYSVASGLGVLLADAVHNAGNVGLCLGKGDTGLEAADDVQV